MHSPSKIYPYLRIFRKDQLAVVHFFEQKGQPPLASDAGVIPVSMDDVAFYENATGAKNILSFEMVIDFRLALEAAKDFFYATENPRHWIGLNHSLPKIFSPSNSASTTYPTST